MQLDQLREMSLKMWVRSFNMITGNDIWFVKQMKRGCTKYKSFCDSVDSDQICTWREILLFDYLIVKGVELAGCSLPDRLF